MRLPRSILAVLACFVIGGVAPAQPANDPQAAIDRLIEAGSYTWEVKERRLTGKGKTFREPPRARGETIIGGFTRAQIRRGDAVLFEREAAYAVAGSWRYYKDLAGEELYEVRKQTGMGTRTGMNVYPLPHDVLRQLLNVARDIRKEQGALVADIDTTKMDGSALQSHLRSGSPFPATASRNVLGLPIPLARPRTRPPSNLSVCVFVYETSGVMERFEVEFSRAVTFLNGPNVGDREVADWKYIAELSAIGRTTPEIPPEARALFLTAPAGP